MVAISAGKREGGRGTGRGSYPTLRHALSEMALPKFGQLGDAHVSAMSLFPCPYHHTIVLLFQHFKLVAFSAQNVLLYQKQTLKRHYPTTYRLCNRLKIRPEHSIPRSETKLG